MYEGGLLGFIGLVRVEYYKFSMFVVRVCLPPCMLALG